MRVARRASTWAAVALLALGPAATAQAVPAAPRPDTSQAQATDSVLEARVRAVAAELRCPVCQGESILDSPAELAQQMKAVVRDQLREGRTPDEIKAFFVARYGEWILLRPAMKGLNIALYVFPVLVVIGGLALVAMLVRRWTSPPPAAG